jgi:tRNA pseudouridine38-40 synthase
MKAEPPSLRRWKCVCAYDGTTFAGWQSQAGGRAIQDIIEARLAQILKTPIRIHGSGRTDSGVHALGQVFHFDAVWPHAPAKLLAAFRVGLPAAIQIKSVQVVPGDFHSRFDATRKRYDYHIYLGDPDPFTRPFCWSIFKPLDLDAMQAAAEVLRGRHDFKAFTALNGTSREDTVRTLDRLDIERRGKRVRIVAEAEGFLYKMVRSLVGAIVATGEGKLTPPQVRALLHARERMPAVQTAPAQGLFLVRVSYR